MQRTISLSPTFQESTDPLDGVGVRFTVTASSATNVPKEVFLFGVRPRAPGATDDLADFLCVCTPPDLADYPADAPTPDMDPPFFRRASVVLDFRSRADADAAYARILADVGVLLDTLARMDRQAAAQPITIARGTP